MKLDTRHSPLTAPNNALTLPRRAFFGAAALALAGCSPKTSEPERVVPKANPLEALAQRNTERLAALKSKAEAPLPGNRPKISKVSLEESPFWNNFEIISGNAPIERARVIGIGHLHPNPFGDPTEAEWEAYRRTSMKIISLVNSQNKKGDVFLAEGAAAKQPLPAVDDLILNVLARTGVTIRGWEDMSLHSTAKRAHMDSQSDGAEVIAASRAGDEVRLDKALTKFEASLERRDRSLLERNVPLRDTVGYYLKGSDTSKVFFLAGRDHLLEDATFDAVWKDIPYLLLNVK